MVATTMAILFLFLFFSSALFWLFFVFALIIFQYVEMGTPTPLKTMTKTANGDKNIIVEQKNRRLSVSKREHMGSFNWNVFDLIPFF